jgi:hypothetical protein
MGHSDNSENATGDIATQIMTTNGPHAAKATQGRA